MQQAAEQDSNTVQTLAVQPFELASAAGRYLIAADSTAGDLLGDATNWLEQAHEILTTVGVELRDEGSQLSVNPEAASSLVWAAATLIEMARSATAAASKL